MLTVPQCSSRTYVFYTTHARAITQHVCVQADHTLWTLVYAPLLPENNVLCSTAAARELCSSTAGPVLGSRARVHRPVPARGKHGTDSPSGHGQAHLQRVTSTGAAHARVTLVAGTYRVQRATAAILLPTSLLPRRASAR